MFARIILFLKTDVMGLWWDNKGTDHKAMNRVKDKKYWADCHLVEKVYKKNTFFLFSFKDLQQYIST